MLANYLKIAWRNLLRSKFFSVLNIVGLAVGITFAMLIGSYVWGEFQVNQQLRHADRQYIVQSKWKQENMGLDLTTLAPIGQALKTQYPTLANHLLDERLKSALLKISYLTIFARQAQLKATFNRILSCVVFCHLNPTGLACLGSV